MKRTGSLNQRLMLAIFLLIAACILLPGVLLAAETWVFCANEGGVCSFSGTTQVRYGAGTSFSILNATDKIACTNDTFGDPLYGTYKHCEYLTNATTTWIFCASENEFCAFQGTALVRFGENSSFYQQTFSGGVACSNGVFGDPIVGTFKHCDYMPARSEEHTSELQSRV